VGLAEILGGTIGDARRLAHTITDLAGEPIDGNPGKIPLEM
jgi:hypothetical protein